MDTNAAGSSRGGASDDKIAETAVWRQSDLFDDAERAALDLAEAMTLTPADVTDEQFAAVRRHFTDEQVVELVAAIAMENYRARFNRAFGIESPHTYEPQGASGSPGGERG
jgi:alkylhydroperoxidase family enzyme